MEHEEQGTNGRKEGTSVRSYADKKAAVIAARAEHLTITGAARATGVGRQTIYDWCANDPEFARALAEAKPVAVDVLKESVYERAFKDPILAMFVIKAHDPDYNDKVQAARAMAQAMNDSPLLGAIAQVRAMLEGRGLQLPSTIEGTAQRLPDPPGQGQQ